MTPPTGDAWTPDPQLLGAYFDGELEGRPEQEALRRNVEAWLESHPAARTELAELRRLRRLCQESPPIEPTPETWDALLSRIEQTAYRPVPRRHAAGRWVAVLLAAAACVALLAWGVLWQRSVRAPQSPAPLAEEPFPVAAAAEIEVLQVEGNDTPTLVVGQLPVQGPLELAGPGDVVLTSVQPDATDQMVPHLRTDGSGRPMIWARVDAEEEP